MSLTKLSAPLAAFVLVVLCALPKAAVAQKQNGWIGSWAASQQLAEPRNSLSPDDLHDVTLRQIVHLSIGGSELRLHLSNRFGTAPLHLASVHIAKPTAAASDKIVSGSDKALSFSGASEVTIPAGADYISDPITFSAPALSDLAITLHADQLPAEQTGHPGSRANSYVAHGDLVSATEIPSAKKVEHWYFIAGIDVGAAPGTAAIVTLGDSITDGHGATTDGNDRWPDVLANRLQANAGTRNLAVLNHGIGGNRLLLDGLGPNALARFDHDVVAQAGARYLIVLEGVNDLGTLTLNGEVPRAEHDALVHRIIAAYEQIVARAHAHDIRVIGATILPYTGSQFYHPGPANEADRQAVNQWIRTPGHFDAVIDFDKVTRDPQHPEQMLPAFDLGDHLHPSPAGYSAMAEAIPLSLFVAAAGSPQLAITFDDLPAHGPLPPGETRMEIASKLLTALRDARVPEAYGFMNGLRLEEQPADAGVLQAWRAAGYLLANHSWSHLDLNQHAAEAFEADVIRNEPLLNQWMKDEDWHWFRFPFLSEGDTPSKSAGIRSFL